MTLNHIFFIIARSFLPALIFFGMGIGSCFSLNNYKVISREAVSDFWFLEDGNWGDASKTYQFQSFSKKPIILHFWSMNCPPCLDEIKALDKVIGEFSSENIQFITINVDSISGGKLKNYLMERNLSNITSYMSPGITRPKIKGLPTTFFINGSFEMVGKIEGVAAWDSDEMKRLIRRLVGTSSADEKPLWTKLKDYIQERWNSLDFEKNYPIVGSLKPRKTIKKHMNSEHTKLIVIGSGPAGYTASIYAARSNLHPIQLMGHEPGGQLMITTDVENFPGFAATIQGPWLMDQMQKQAIHVGAKLVYEHVSKVDFSTKPLVIETDAGKTYTADAVIISTGAQARWLGTESETKFRGFGVSGCATCDGFFFKGKEVAVVGGGNTAVEEALFLTNFATKVTLIHRRDSLRAEKILQDRLFKNKKIEILWDTVIDEVLGTEDPKDVTGLKIKNLKTNEMRVLNVQGLFVAIGHIPRTELFTGILELDSEGYILCKPGTTQTNIPGVFAAGDVQDKVYRQAVTAAGQGCMAALEAEKYLSTQGQ